MEENKQLSNGMTEREYYNSLMKDDPLFVPCEELDNYFCLCTVRCRNKDVMVMEAHRSELKKAGYEVSEKFPLNLWGLKEWSGFRLNIKQKPNEKDWQSIKNWSLMYGSPTKEELESVKCL